MFVSDPTNPKLGVNWSVRFHQFSKTIPCGITLRFFDVLHLLQIYQGIISARPIEMGNREFLSCLISASLSLGDALLEVPHHSGPSSKEVVYLINLLNRQNPLNAKSIAVDVLKIIREMNRRYLKNENSPELYIKKPLSAFHDNYSAIQVIFGPGLGLGDQITFVQFMNAIARHYPHSRITIFTLYPNLWKHLLPQAREVHYRGKPFRPFSYLELRKRNASKEERELVLIADFECFNLHKDVISSSPGRDVLEIALGRKAAWLNKNDSHWIEFEDYFSVSVIDNNYWMLAKMANRLFNESASQFPWQAIKKRTSNRLSIGQKTIFLNPFTSKGYILKPHDWLQVLEQIQSRLPPKIKFETLVFPGLNSASQKYAAEICRLCTEGQNPIATHCLKGKNNSLLTPYNAFSTLIDALQYVDLAITVDTCTAHFIPLFSVPTLVITDRENRSFWVPGSWSFYCLIDGMFSALPDLAIHILSITSQHYRFSKETRESIERLIKITEKDIRKGITQQMIYEIPELLSDILEQIDSTFPYRFQAKQWSLHWSRLALAIQNEPIELHVLQPYLHRWQESEFYKLLKMSTTI